MNVARPWACLRSRCSSATLSLTPRVPGRGVDPSVAPRPSRVMPAISAVGISVTPILIDDDDENDDDDDVSNE